jgi:hypothetical protein
MHSAVLVPLPELDEYGHRSESATSSWEIELPQFVMLSFSGETIASQVENSCPTHAAVWFRPPLAPPFISCSPVTTTPPAAPRACGSLHCRSSAKLPVFPRSPRLLWPCTLRASPSRPRSCLIRPVAPASPTRALAAPACLISAPSTAHSFILASRDEASSLRFLPSVRSASCL